MLPGTLAGLYQPHDMEIDLHRFCTSCDVRLIVADAVGFDPKKRRVHFNDRPEIRFDVASIGIGSVPNAAAVWRDHPDVLSIKPMATFLRRLVKRLEAADAAGSDEQLQVSIVGAGAAGLEVTFCLDAFLKTRETVAALTLIDSGETALPGYEEKTIRLAGAELQRRGIALVTGARVQKFNDGQLQLADGKSMPADLVIWATGASPPPVLEQFDLPKADDGFLAVHSTLQTTADAKVFVVGDTATLIDNPVPKAGVYAVRQGPVLWANIQRMFAGRDLTRYDPQRGFLSMLATGDGRAIGQYKGFSFHGGWVWKWKDRIDRKFMRMYQDYRPMSAEMGAQRSAKDASPTGSSPPAMRCRGCGGKVGANVLAAALERLDVPPSPYVKQGLNPPDDAAVLDPKVATADVLSVDFFPAFIDDPYLVGRVAALNSLSDLWATGARPLGAMAMVTLPEGAANQQAELLYQLVAGGLHELNAVDAALLGGHTTEGEELIIGYSVVGDLGGAKPFSKAGLKPGDRLILTKSLGTGVLLAAHMQSACRAPWVDAMLVTMLRRNAEAATIARDFELTAVTDVTGFGLAGHLLEMLDASSVNAKLGLAELPLLDGFAELSASGIHSTLDPANRETADRIDLATSDVTSRPEYDALFDPQTSGGMLIGVSADATEAILSKLREAGYEQAAVIGIVTESTTAPARLSVTATLEK
jgi:selenide,water dikinase